MHNVLRHSIVLFVLFTSAVAPAFANRANERRQFEAAYAAAGRGPAGSWRALAAGLGDYPLVPYLEFAALSRTLDSASPATVEGFLDAQQGSVLERDLRARWLRKLAAQKRWKEFHRLYRQQNDLELRCHAATARIAERDVDTLFDEARALYVTGKSLPPACDPVVAWIKSQKAFGAELVWERIRNAAAARESALIAHLAKDLPANERATATRWSTAIANPAAALANVGSWPDTPKDRELVALATAQLARGNPTLGAQRLALVERRYTLDDATRAPAIDQIALQKAASYEPDAAAWLARLSPTHAAETVREWRVRVALASRDYATVLVAYDALTDKQRADPRFRYIRARALEELKRDGEAQAGFAALAREANYHGFLSADRLGVPYAICPDDEKPTPDAVKAAQENASLERAFELHAIGWTTFARREWDYATREADAAFRRAAVTRAHALGWVDRGPLTLLRPDETRWYSLRFPVAYEKEVERGAKKHGLDVGWVFGLIRSESAWVTDARSTADARGLMQLLPGVGAQTAKREKLAFRADDLYRPETNIALGTSHLASELKRHGGRVWLATAAYNAGPAPVQRWLAQRGATLPTDLWVETIPYKETREYVARVLAFAVIYDWRLDGDAQPLAPRLAIKPAKSGRREVACPVRTSTAP